MKLCSNSRMISFSQALYRATIASGRIPEVAEALGVRSKALQAAMRSEIAFVDVVTLGYGTQGKLQPGTPPGTPPNSSSHKPGPPPGVPCVECLECLECPECPPECLNAEQRERVRARLEAAGLPTVIVKMSSIAVGSWEKGALVIVEYDAGEGFGCIACPSQKGQEQTQQTQPMEKELGEALVLECSSALAEHMTQRLRSSVGIHMKTNEALREQIDENEAAITVMTDLLTARREARQRVAIEIGDVQKSTVEANGRLAAMVTLRDRLTADLEERKAENAAIVRSAAADRDVARAEAERMRKEVCSILKRTVELKRQADVSNKKLASVRQSKEDADRSIDAWLVQAEEAKERAEKSQKLAEKSIKRSAERSAARAEEAVRRSDALVADSTRKIAAAEQVAAKAREAAVKAAEEGRVAKESAGRMSEEARMDATAAERALAELVAARDAERSRVATARDDLAALQERVKAVSADVAEARALLEARTALLGGIRGALAGASREINRETLAALARIDAVRARVEMNLIG